MRMIKVEDHGKEKMVSLSMLREDLRVVQAEVSVLYNATRVMEKQLANIGNGIEQTIIDVEKPQEEVEAAPDNGKPEVIDGKDILA
jgi:hypothetical protein